MNSWQDRGISLGETVMKQLRSFLNREAAAALENNKSIHLFRRGVKIFCPVFSLRAALWIKQRHLHLSFNKGISGHLTLLHY